MFAAFECLRRKFNLDLKILQLEVKFRVLKKKINTLNVDIFFPLEGDSSPNGVLHDRKLLN